MYKKPLILTAILGTFVFAACRQPDPTPINSTLNKHPNQTSGVQSTNSNGSVHTEMHETSHREPMTHDEMNHSTMQTAPNAAAQPYDLQFLDTMIAHHQGAIEMAKPATVKARNADLKALAFKIVADQEREIGEFKRLREQFYANQPAALNMEMAGMADSMKNMNMVNLMKLNGDEFDVEFANQMIPHHQGAIVMAREALTKAEHAEIKTIANQIIQAQEAEIKQLESIKASYKK